MKQLFVNMRRRRWGALLLSVGTAVSMLLWLMPLHAQEPPPQPAPLPHPVTETIVTGDGIPQLRLTVPFRLQTAEGFRADGALPSASLVYTPAGGVAQRPLTSLTVAPLTVLLLLDNSGSMEAALPDAVAAAAALVEAAPPQTRFALLLVNADLTYAQPLTTHRQAVQQALQQAAMTDEASCLHDGLVTAVDTLTQLEPDPSRRAIVFLSDGFDERTRRRPGILCSTQTADAAVTYAAEAEVPVYGYAFPGLRGEDAAPSVNAPLFVKFQYRTGGLRLGGELPAADATAVWTHWGVQWVAQADFFTPPGTQQATLHVGEGSAPVWFEADTDTMPQEQVTAVCEPYRARTQTLTVRDVAVTSPQPRGDTVVAVVAADGTGPPLLTRTLGMTETAVTLDLSRAALVEGRAYQVEIRPLSPSGMPLERLLPPSPPLVGGCVTPAGGPFSFNFLTLPLPSLTLDSVTRDADGNWQTAVTLNGTDYFRELEAHLLYDPFWGRPQLYRLTSPAAFTLPPNTPTASLLLSWSPPSAHADLDFNSRRRLFNRHTLLITGLDDAGQRLATVQTQPPTLFDGNWFNRGSLLYALFAFFLFLLLLALALLLWELRRVRRAPLPAAGGGPLLQTATSNPQLSLAIQQTPDRRHEQRAFTLDAQSVSRAPWSAGRLNCDLMLPGDGLLAERHVQIRFDAQSHTFQVMDLGSANKTWLNNRQLPPYVWEPLPLNGRPLELNLGGRTILELTTAGRR